MKIRALLVIVVVSGLAACQSAGMPAGYFGNPVSVGTGLEVLAPLPVPAGLARVYLQAGEVLRYVDIDQYQPFCYFLMHAPAPLARDIQPARFTVRSVMLREQDVRLRLPVRVAGWGAAGVSDGLGVIAFETHMLLAVPDQADPERLVCSGAFAPPFEAAPIRLEEMRQALGSWVVVRLPQSSGSPR